MNKKLIAVIAVAMLMPFSVLCMIHADDSEAASHVWYTGSISDGAILTASSGDAITFIISDGFNFSTTPSWLTYSNNQYSGNAVAGTHALSLISMAPGMGMISKSFTLSVSAPLQYTVSFNAQGGTAVSPMSVNQGSSLTLPNTTRAGHAFNGWYTAASGGNFAGNAGASYTPTANVTLYASWTPLQYTVTFDAQGGTAVSPMTVNQGSSLTLPNTTKTNHTFNGWYTAASGGTKVGNAGGDYAPNSNITLYARWTANALSITGGVDDVNLVAGTAWSRTVTTSPSADSITVSGASWLTKNGMTLTGTPVAGDYTITVTAKKTNYADATESFSIHVDPQLVFTSVPTADMIIYEA